MNTIPLWTDSTCLLGFPFWENSKDKRQNWFFFPFVTWSNMPLKISFLSILNVEISNCNVFPLLTDSMLIFKLNFLLILMDKIHISMFSSVMESHFWVWRGRVNRFPGDLQVFDTFLSKNREWALIYFYPCWAWIIGVIPTWPFRWCHPCSFMNWCYMLLWMMLDGKIPHLNVFPPWTDSIVFWRKIWSTNITDTFLKNCINKLFQLT